MTYILFQWTQKKSFCRKKKCVYKFWMEWAIYIYSLYSLRRFREYIFFGHETGNWEMIATSTLIVFIVSLLHLQTHHYNLHTWSRISSCICEVGLQSCVVLILTFKAKQKLWACAKSLPRLQKQNCYNPLRINAILSVPLVLLFFVIVSSSP